MTIIIIIILLIIISTEQTTKTIVSRITEYENLHKYPGTINI